MKIKSLAHAADILENRALKHTHEWEEAFIYMIEFGPAEVKEKIDEGIKKFFPEAAALMEQADEHGTITVSSDELKRVMGVTDEDIEQAASNSREFSRKYGTSPDISPAEPEPTTPVIYLSHVKGNA